MIRQLVRKPTAFVGLTLLAFIACLAIAGAVYTPFDPLAFDLENRLAPPSAQHLLGTDQFGRDVLSRLLSAAGVTVVTSTLTVLFAVVSGTVLGSIGGYYGGVVDRIVVALVDAFMALPSIVMALAIMAVIGPNRYGVVLALGFAYMPNVARVVRGAVLSIRQSEYVEASRSLGNSHAYSLVRHVVPNCITPLTVVGTALFASALLAESALSFLGLGVPPPAPTWGGILSDGRQFFAVAPWLSVYPGMAISMSLVGINLFGDAMRDFFDPRMANL